MGLERVSLCAEAELGGHWAPNASVVNETSPLCADAGPFVKSVTGAGHCCIKQDTTLATAFHLFFDCTAAKRRQRFKFLQGAWQPEGRINKGFSALMSRLAVPADPPLFAMPDSLVRQTPTHRMAVRRLNVLKHDEYS
jgi:hypothetical protein